MERETNLVGLATELTIAWLGNSNTRSSAEEVPGFLRAVHAALATLDTPAVSFEEQRVEYRPAVTARRSLASPDHIVSMIDGKPYRTLRRHLSTHGLTPAQYRERYNLRPDYPMVAPTYSEARRAMAKKIGLGRKPGQTRAQGAPATKPAAPTRGRGKRGAGGSTAAK
ncbi:transcriptional regulator [Sphingomonas sp. MA1305]|jgi:predicted transcriptional regulator|uniref:MucR family transcriptional regulator n=1 Tax=Sphingomonas sp. MA1305 TaxID=2479204 RepID=UPI0018DFE75E|nr:MucR family transcriptional regulator [Sphingomonas sp. MA1305]MBI0477024.1 transcriptional regulator [Sphingomonas sp. MA1305]